MMISNPSNSQDKILQEEVVSSNDERRLGLILTGHHKDDDIETLLMKLFFRFKQILKNPINYLFWIDPLIFHPYLS